MENGRAYIAGTFKDSGENKVCFWEDLVQTYTSPFNSGVNDITVVNGAVYAAGWYYDDVGHKDIACYWKDGNPTPLSDLNSEALAIVFQ